MNVTLQLVKLRVPIQKVNQKVTKYKNAIKVPLNLTVLDLEREERCCLLRSPGLSGYKKE